MKFGRRATRTALAAVASVALFAAACTGAEVATEDDPAEPDEAEEESEDEDAADDLDDQAEEAPEDAILIGSLHPLTGGLAEDGIAMDDAVRMAIDDINEAGGIESMGGRELAILSADSEGSPEVGQTEAQRMFDQDISALVGAYQSAVNVNVASLAERTGVPFIIDVGVADNIITPDSRYTFRIQPNATDNGVLGAATLAEIRELTGESIETVAHLHDETEFGTSIAAAFAAAASENGIEVVEAIAYDPFGVSDLTTELSRVDAAGVDLVLITGYYPDGVLMAREAFAVQPNVKAVVGIASGAIDIEEFPEDTDGAGELYLNSNYHFDATSERTQELRARYAERFDRPMRTAAVLSYQAVEIIAAGLEIAGSSDRAELRDGISQASIADPLIANGGPIEFDESGENINARPILLQIQNGEVLQVYPEEFQQAELIFPGVPWDNGS